ncbi:hypothetical protein HUJ04_006573 [Dendroctonus ponderosae]|uniref:BHLH domain-containing protein n=2 Tax=Dendroctonus ponderosae TaxID=77166 RepID=A0AAR5PQA1_DENPD|nr:hypothetical protein HUJ04_006573 [Dendroctonus ponderosae]
MPLSDNEFQSSDLQEPQANTLSRAQLRKSHKPIMEKRRRARINHCLNEIKNLLLEAKNQDPSRHTKLEKADILEMAVQHLQNIQQKQIALAAARDPTVIGKFKNGFTDCASEIDRFISSSDSVDTGIRDRVTDHLQKCMSDLNKVAPFVSTVATVPLLHSTDFFTSANQSQFKGGTGDQNNNPRVQIPQGIQLIPSRLSTGELALLVPNSSNLSYFPSLSLPNRPSAFVAVTPQAGDPPRILSPPLSPIEVPPKADSSKGFRPIPRPKPGYPGGDHQVPQITSTVSNVEKHFSAPMEVKTIKFPIHKPLDKERKLVEHTSVIRKLSEPLCVITNRGERFKQAQQKEDSIRLEENQFIVRGTKRVYSEMNQHPEVFPFAANESFMRPSKIIKTAHHVVPTATYVGPSLDHQAASEEETERSSSSVLNEEEPEAPLRSVNLLEPLAGAQNNEQRDDMWRPW